MEGYEGCDSSVVSIVQDMIAKLDGITAVENVSLPSHRDGMLDNVHNNTMEVMNCNNLCIIKITEPCPTSRPRIVYVKFNLINNLLSMASFLSKHIIAIRSDLYLHMTVLYIFDL